MLESAAASTPASGLGRIIDGRYRLEEKLGGGSAGSTYRARRVQDARVFAIKLYDDDVSADAARRSRFEWEAATLAGLGHPNVVSIVDYGVFAGRRYLVSEWLDGESLAQRMRRGSLPLAAAVGITRQVLAALASAHGARLAHRNLKPSDVFLEFRKPGRERVKLLDFAPAMATPCSGPKGGRSYSPPELAAGEALDARSDVYAVGALLSGMLYGGPSDVPVLAGPASAVDRTRASRADRGPTVDSTLQGWIRRAMARDRLERFNDAAEMLQQLIDLLPRDLRSPPDSYETSRVSSVGIPSPLRSDRQNDGRRNEPAHPLPEQQFESVRGYTLHIEEARPRTRSEVEAKRVEVRPNAQLESAAQLEPPPQLDRKFRPKLEPKFETRADHEAVAKLKSAVEPESAPKVEPAPSATSDTGKRARLRPREALLAAAAAARGETPVALPSAAPERVDAQRAEPKRVERVDAERAEPKHVARVEPERMESERALSSEAPETGGVDTWRAAIASLSVPAPAAEAPAAPPSLQADAHSEAATDSVPPAVTVPGSSHGKSRKTRAARRAERRANKAAKRARNGKNSLAAATQSQLDLHDRRDRQHPAPGVDRSSVSGLDADRRGAVHAARTKSEPNRSERKSGSAPAARPAAASKADSTRKSDLARRLAPQPQASRKNPQPLAATPTRASEPNSRSSRAITAAALQALSPRAANAARVVQSMSRRGLAETRVLVEQGWVTTTAASRAVAARVSPVLARSPLTAAALGFSALFAVFVAMIGPGKDVRAVRGSLHEAADTALDAHAAEAANLDTEETSLAPSLVPSAAEALRDAKLGVGTAAAPRGAAAIGGPPRPPARNPWTAAIPAELEGVPALAANGARGDEVLMRKLREYSRAHPQDPRACLLLGRVYLNRLWRSDAVAQFALALERDPTARGAPELLPALLELIVLGKASSGAEALIIKGYGREALGPIETQMRVLRSSASVARLKTVRDKLVAR